MNRTFRTSSLYITSLVLLSGCEGGSDEPWVGCQLPSDCRPDQTCELNRSESVGTCVIEARPEPSLLPDSGPALSDSGSSAVEDGGPLDGGELDGGPDAGSIDDAGDDPRDQVQWITVESSTIRLDWMRTEVTEALYDACVATGTCSPVTGCTRRGPAYPVGCLTLMHANQVCRYLGGSLPSKDEYEDQSTNGGTTLFPWGDSLPTCQNVNHLCADRSTRRPCELEAGSNGVGICNLADNVGEWSRTPVPSETDGFWLCGIDVWANALNPEEAGYCPGWQVAEYEEPEIGARCVRYR